MGPIVDYIEALIASGHAYPADGDVYFRVRSDAGYGSLSHRRLEDMEQGEEVEGADRKEDPLDFALWKGHKEGEDTSWESPWGPGRPGWHIECSAMAEELLGVGFDIHGGGSDLVFPHHENEAAQTRAARGTELARLWMHNGMIQFTGREDGQVGREHRPAARGARALRARDRRHVPDLRPLPPAAGLLRGGARAGPVERQPHPRGRAAAVVGRLTRRPGPAARRASSMRSPATSTRRRRLRSLNEWIREATGPLGDAPGDAASARDARRAGPGGPAGARRPQAPERVRDAGRTARACPRGSATSPRADRLREEIAALGWEVRDGAERLRASSRCDPLRSQPRLRGAARAPGGQRVGEVWATAGAAREPWLEGIEVRMTSAEEIEHRCGSSAHQGVCADAGAYPYASAAELLSGARSPGGGARSGPGPAEPRVDLPHGRVRRRGGGGDPRAPGGRGHPGGVQGLGRGRRAPARGAGAQHGRLPRRGPQGGVLVLRGQRFGCLAGACARALRRPGLLAARESCSCWAARAAACARGWRRRAMS